MIFSSVSAVDLNEDLVGLDHAQLLPGALLDHLDAFLEVVHLVDVQVERVVVDEDGIPLDRVFEEVHRSNMAKLVDGKPVRREDGKILKPEGWTPPDMKKFVK